MVNIFVLTSCRLKVLNPLEEETTRLTLWVELVESKPGTSKRREMLVKVIQLPKREDVSPSSCSNPCFLDNWSVKAKRRNNQGTGRMRYLKKVFRKEKNGFREGTKPKSNKRRSGEQKKWDRWLDSFPSI